jgi:superfamily I DNA and/or RNA helicase
MIDGSSCYRCRVLRAKRKAREQKESDAAAKRLLFGRTKGEKERETKQKDAEIRKLDGAKREKDEEKK